MNINDFLNCLAANASRNYKIEQLTLHKDNELLKEVVRLANDPFTQFYIRKIPKYTPNQNPLGDNLDWALDQLVTMLASRKVTGNAAIEHLQYILESVTADNAKVVERIIDKSLNAGFSEGTANKVWPGLVHEYPVMLCSPFEQKLVDKIKFPAYAQMKMDGMRFNAIVRGGTVEYRSRNGKEIHLLGNLDEQFLTMAGGVDLVFDGELLVMFDGDHQFADRQTGNGILNKANKGTISEKAASQVHASVWDLIPYDQFIVGKCSTPYSKRFSNLQEIIIKQEVKNKKVWLVSSQIVETIEKAQEMFQEYLALGYEGIILKDGSGIWEDKRAKHQIKFKGELECDLKIVGVQAGTGKYEGMLGAILCESSDGVVKVSVGSGFNDNHRKNLITEKLLDKIVAVKYNMRSVDKQGNHSLFLPIFIELRDDKDIADSSEDIK